MNQNAQMARIPPQNIEAEQAVLGAMMLQREAIDIAAEILDSEYLYREAHKRIFDSIVNLYYRNEAVDLLTVSNELKAKGWLENVGGTIYLSRLLDSVDTTAHVEYHTNIIRDKAVLRRLIYLATKIVKESYDESEAVDELLDRAEQMIFEVSEKRLKSGFISMKDVMKETFEIIEEHHEQAQISDVTGLSTGFRELDILTAGLQKSDLIIIAGRPSMGKTSFCLDIARHVGAVEKKSVGLFSLEMSRWQLVQRMLCSEARIDGHRLRTNRISDEEWPRVSLAVGKLGAAPIYIDDSPAVGVLEMRAKARRLTAQSNLDLLIIDYLQLMQGPKGKENRQQEISQISRSLKILAKELNIPVIALSQLSRAVEARGGDRRPQLSDLRDSGAIEQDADVVMFIYRGERYGIEEEEGIAEIIIGKQRNGPVGTVRLAFRSEYTRFENLAYEEESHPY
ncbi:MAG: replicative DNA helicase [Candidatus Cloacimonetes bacterium 4572_55]|nr:MAG: replicative DNA helicase [Candidatus Cloacimonetes bacterium 4572_55]